MWNLETLTFSKCQRKKWDKNNWKILHRVSKAKKEKIVHLGAAFISNLGVFPFKNSIHSFYSHFSTKPPHFSALNLSGEEQPWISTDCPLLEWLLCVHDKSIYLGNQGSSECLKQICRWVSDASSTFLIQQAALRILSDSLFKPSAQTSILIVCDETIRKPKRMFKEPS